MNMLSLETILRVKDSEGNKIRLEKGRGFSEGYVVSLVTPTNWVWLEGAYEWNITKLGVCESFIAELLVIRLRTRSSIGNIYSFWLPITKRMQYYTTKGYL